MCKFHRGLNVHKPLAVFSPSQTWKTAPQEFMMSRNWVEVSVTRCGSFISQVADNNEGD